MSNPQIENKKNGFILISRSLLDSSVFQNEKWLKVWLWCLMKANHTTTQIPVRTGRGNSTITIRRGQLLFGRNSASKKLNMPPSTVRNIVYKLATLGNLDIKEDSHYSVITIRKYAEYQNPENYRRTGKRTGKGQAKDTYNNDKNDKYINKESSSYKLAELLLNGILKNNQHSRLHNLSETEKVKTVARWAEDIDLLINKDGQETSVVEEVIKFTTSDDFWSAHILSAAKLRNKWDTLVKQYSSKRAIQAKKKDDSYIPPHDDVLSKIKKAEKEMEEQKNGKT